MVIVAGGMVVFLGVAGLALDSGRAFLVRSELSRAVDAGVLAGARALRSGETSARNQAPGRGTSERGSGRRFSHVRRGELRSQPGG